MAAEEQRKSVVHLRRDVIVCCIAACVARAASALALPAQSIRVGEHIRVSVGLESRPLVTYNTR